MKLHSHRTVAVLLAGGALLYAVGALAEASAHLAPAANQTPRSQSSPVATGGETGNEGTEKHGAPGTAAGNPEAVGGFNLESPLFVAVAVIVFVALAISLWLTGAAALLVGAGVIALGAVVLDVREIAHQLDQGRPVIVLIAALLVAVHLLTAVVAAVILRAPRAGSS